MLMIRQKTGLERVRSFMTGTREYRCRDCDQKFRAPDRRSVPREEKLPASVKTSIG
jgi:tRNA(Ile2) C34 agmatinyltransferase TiaS